MEKLIEHFKANRGTQSRLAEHLGLQPSTVSQWKEVPAQYVLEVERMTGVSRHDLRPDVFGEAQASETAA
jgi:DNA-binding transcriptional regulator YdaS (Cro superfamily)